MATGTHDSTATNHIMLRFRPILPKPAAEGALSVVGSQNAVVSKRRVKRKYVRVRRTFGRRKNSKLGKLERTRSPVSENAAVVTLPLLPEKDEPNYQELTGKNFDQTEKIQIVDNPGPPRVTEEIAGGGVSDQVAAAATATAVVESWVTVESVTSNCMGEGGGGLLGCTDVERVKVLETDACPGFISDGYCRVRWVNDAFKRMVVSGEREGDPWPEVVVWLKVKENASWCCYSYPAFTCGVRLQYTWRNEKCKKMVPCDVWRLDSGGFAWRLDVKAALSLGI